RPRLRARRGPGGPGAGRPVGVPGDHGRDLGGARARRRGARREPGARRARRAPRRHAPTGRRGARLSPEQGARPAAPPPRVAPRGDELGPLLASEVRVEGRRPWFLAAASLGLVGVVVSGAVAAGRGGLDRTDAYRAGGATTLLVVGPGVAVGLGATAVQRDAASGWLGLLVGAGARRGRLALARGLARLALVLATVAVWGVALQVGSAALGEGLDGPLAVHTCAMAENLALAL